MMHETTAGVAPANRSNATELMDSGVKRIGEMAEEFGVTLRTLRFYEDKGLIHPLREGSTRFYTHRDQVRLKLVLLGRKVGFSLREVKQMMDLYDPQGTNMRQLKVALEKSERQLARLHQQREALDEAIGELQKGVNEVRLKLEAAAQKAKASA